MPLPDLSRLGIGINVGSPAVDEVLSSGDTLELISRALRSMTPAVNDVDLDLILTTAPEAFDSHHLDGKGDYGTFTVAVAGTTGKNRNLATNQAGHDDDVRGLYDMVQGDDGLETFTDVARMALARFVERYANGGRVEELGLNNPNKFVAYDDKKEEEVDILQVFNPEEEYPHEFDENGSAGAAVKMHMDSNVFRFIGDAHMFPTVPQSIPGKENRTSVSFRKDKIEGFVMAFAKAMAAKWNDLNMKRTNMVAVVAPVGRQNVGRTVIDLVDFEEGYHGSGWRVDIMDGSPWWIWENEHVEQPIQDASTFYENLFNTFGAGLENGVPELDDEQDGIEKYHLAFHISYKVKIAFLNVDVLKALNRNVHSLLQRLQQTGTPIAIAL